MGKKTVNFCQFEKGGSGKRKNNFPMMKGGSNAPCTKKGARSDNNKTIPALGGGRF